MHRRVARSISSQLLIAAGVAIGSAAHADLRVDDPPACIDVAALRNRFSPAVLDQAAVAVRSVDGHYVVQLGTADGKGTASRTRTLAVRSCEEAREAVATILTLTESEQGDAEAPRAEPAAAAAAAPHDETPVAVAPAPTSPERTAPAARATPLTIVVGADGIVDVGTLGAASFGARARVALDRGALRAQLGGVALAPQRSSAAGVPGVALDLLAGQLGVCGAPWLGATTLRGCVGGELGRLAASGVDLTAARDRSAAWAALTSGATFGVRIVDSVRVAAALDLVWPLTRPVFYAEGSNRDLHRTEMVALRGGIGAEVDLP